MGCDSQFDGLHDREPTFSSRLPTPEQRVLANEIGQRGRSIKHWPDAYVRVLTDLIDSRIQEAIHSPAIGKHRHAVNEAHVVGWTDNIDRT